MSIFSDINFDRGSDNPFGLEPGTYETVISEAFLERSQSKALGLWVTFSAEDGKSIRKWVTMPEEDQDQKTYDRNVSFLKLFFKNLEIPEEQWAKLNPDDLIGIECVITVTPQKKNPEYNQVNKITRKGKGMSPSTASDNMDIFRQPGNVPSDGGFKY